MSVPVQVGIHQDRNVHGEGFTPCPCCDELQIGSDKQRPAQGAGLEEMRFYWIKRSVRPTPDRLLDDQAAVGDHDRNQSVLPLRYE